MAGCPFRDFGKCPETNQEGGCQFWISYKSGNSEDDGATAQGCALVLTPILLIQNINNLAVVANEVNKVGNEIAARRFESIRDNEAIRVQMLTLAGGTQQLVVPDFTIKKEGEEQPQEAPAEAPVNQ